MEKPEWMVLAEAELGKKEIPGDGNNPSIQKYWTAIGKGTPLPDSVPWCAAFVNYILKEAGLKGTSKPNARSFLKWGMRIIEPKFGDIVVFYRGNKKGWQGHVAFYHSKSRIPGYIKVLGGNQKDQVSIARYPNRKILGYRRPWSLEVGCE